ncbi:heme lyase NrfEFG subunit NrfF [Cricetibacter osteomyelitidis]
MKKVNFYLFVISLFFAFFATAEMVDTHQFKNNDDRLRAVALAKSLRCPQCQNQNLVESNSPIAYDLRLEVYKMVDDGKSNQEIIDVMTSRFGNFVLYKPPFQWTTALLWLAPFFLLLLSAGLMWRYLRQRQQQSIQSNALDHTQQQALKTLLNQQDK